DDLQFLDTLVLKLDGRGTVEAVGDGHAVHHYDDLAGPTATDVEAAPIGDAGLDVEDLTDLLDGEPVDRFRRHARFRTGHVLPHALSLRRDDDLFALEHLLTQGKILLRRQVHAHLHALPSHR